MKVTENELRALDEAIAHFAADAESDDMNWRLYKDDLAEVRRLREKLVTHHRHTARSGQTR